MPTLIFLGDSVSIEKRNVEGKSLRKSSFQQI